MLGKKQLCMAALSCAIVVTGLAGLPGSAGAKQTESESVGTFVVYKDKAGEFRWRLKARNGKVIAIGGEGYATKSSCLDSIELVRKYAAKAKLTE